ncbi:hypothetical protein [Trueperella pecoris]|nr:hypothetical protein [Trueperella pecoris]QOQ39645.1 hypothetical protein HLG82_09465 [Trueperella pecoris]
MKLSKMTASVALAALVVGSGGVVTASTAAAVDGGCTGAGVCGVEP